MKNRLLYLALSFLLALTLYAYCASGAVAESEATLELSNDGQTVFTAVDPSGNALFSICGSISEGDEYISGDNILYRVISVSGTQAIAERIGEETMPDVSWLKTG